MHSGRIPVRVAFYGPFREPLVNIEQTTLTGVSIISMHRFGDARGWMCETYKESAFAEAGLPTGWVQDNHSFSAMQGTLRGLHYQAPPYAQDKLVRCTRGAIWDVAVDVRRGSPQYGHWVGVELTAENGRQLLVPKGFLHGFVTTAPDTEVQYKVSDRYAPTHEGGVAWDSVGIDWPVRAPLLSDKDQAAPAFDDWTSPFMWEG